MSLLALLSRFPDCPVLVVGDLMLDEFVWGQVSRISPEAPVPVVEVTRRSFTLGGAANTAANIRGLGGKAFLAGMIGTDSSATQFRELLSNQGIDATAILAEDTRPTITKTRIIAGSQQVVRIDQEQPLGPHTDWEAHLLQRIETLFPKVKACIISDYGKGVISNALAQGVIQAASRAGVPTIVDPKGVDYLKYRGATLVKPNQLEAGKVLNRDLRSSSEVEQAGFALQELLGEPTTILITRGAQGMNLFERGRPALHVPTVAREVFDVTGAGDTVAATLTLTLAVGGDLEAGCRLASIAAAQVVSKMGTATCTLQELATALEHA